MNDEEKKWKFKIFRQKIIFDKIGKNFKICDFGFALAKETKSDLGILLKFNWEIIRRA